MESAFQYNKAVTGKQFIGRTNEIRVFVNLLAQGENIVLYEPPKTGKKSLIQQGFYTMKSSGSRFVPVQLSLLDIRSLSDLAVRLASNTLRSEGNGPDDFARIAQELLPGTHLVFDRARFDACGEVLSPSWELDDEDLRAAFLLPYRLGERTGVPRIVVLDEFQNIMLTEDGDRACRILEEVFKTLPETLSGRASYVFLGSQVNAMHGIFGIKRWFWRHVERIPIPPLDTKEIMEHVVRGFLATGKVIDRELLLGVCKLFQDNIWYINHFSAICDSLTRGYIMEQTLTDALSSLIAIHEPRFIATMNDLTTFQVSLLRAILEGHTRFSSAEVIKQYALNSSANVRRLKDALCKKEIVTFDENDNPVLLDPLFEYWVRKYYFNMSFE
ncbi:MAG: ATP-binding protein [Bacteroidales bacterium]|nr:ATP-binding protein [Bacteroidales bacterium]